LELYRSSKQEGRNDMEELTTMQTTDLTVSQVEDLYSKFVAFLDATPKTAETYKKAIRQLFVYLSLQGISRPQREDIIAFREDLKASGHKPTTVQNYITAAKLFFRWTAQEGYYPDITDHMKGAKIDREHKRDYLTANQVKAVLDGIERDTLQGLRDYAMLSLMVTGGLRDIEVSRADIGDLRTAGESTVLYVQGKGRQEKTEYIKISAPVEKALRAYLRERGEATEGAPLFASLSNNSKGGRLSTRSVSGTVKQRLKAAGYNSERLTAHSLRHTAVTLSLLAGKRIDEVQQFARHANIATTMIYNHSLDKAKNSCSDAISAAIYA
jgi:integrase/recombinase XerD